MIGAGAPHTVRAYVATAHRLIEFLGRYRGEEIGRFALLNLHASDLRAFLADRRGEGLGASSAAREMSAVRAFLTFAAEAQGNAPQLPRTRAPKRPRTLPRPASPGDAIALAEEAGAAAPNDWIGARDLAILLLLYGAGLRVAEAMGLTARVLPLGQAMRVTGKRGKTRIVPLVPAVKEAITAYVALCPYPLAGDAPLFVGAKGGPLNPDLVRRAVRSARARLGLARQPDAPCAAPQLCDASAGARSGSAVAAGIAGPRQPVVDADLYRSRRRALARRLSPRPSAGLIAAKGWSGQAWQVSSTGMCRWVQTR